MICAFRKGCDETSQISDIRFVLIGTNTRLAPTAPFPECHVSDWRWKVGSPKIKMSSIHHSPPMLMEVTFSNPDERLLSFTEGKNSRPWMNGCCRKELRTAILHVFFFVFGPKCPLQTPGPDPCRPFYIRNWSKQLNLVFVTHKTMFIGVLQAVTKASETEGSPAGN